MKNLRPAALAFVVVLAGTQAQAQSRYDRCAAYARDAMMAFYSSSAVPESMVTRERETMRSTHIREPDPLAGKAADQGSGSLLDYFDRCMAR